MQQYHQQLRAWLMEAIHWHQEQLRLLEQASNERERLVTNVRFSTQPNVVPGRIYKQYRLAPLWKRLSAEALDFFVLLAFKFCVVIMTFEFVTTYDLEYVRYWGEQHTMAVTLAFMEIAQLLLSVFYETAFLSSDRCATLGKRYMGIQVLHAVQIIHIPGFMDPSLVAVYPATKLSVPRALVRTFCKHILWAFIFPVFFSFLTLGSNRTRYDLYSNTVVVEYNPNPVPVTN